MLDFEKNRVSRILGAIPPVWLAIFGSLILSFVALCFEPILGRDSAFYVDNAKAFVEHGNASLLERFSWPWFSALIGVTHSTLGLSCVVSAYLWVFLFSAGLCACVVRCVEQINPKAGYWAVLVVLTIPAFNEYRSELLREHGFWFFAAMCMMLMTRYQLRSDKFALFGAVVCVALASLFRLEALFMVAAIGGCVLWAHRETVKAQYLKGGALLAGFIAVMTVVFWSLDAMQLSRVQRYLDFVDPLRFWDSVSTISGSFADSTLRYSSKDLAPLIILSGFWVAIVFSILKMMGVYVLPFLWSLFQRNRGSVFQGNAFGVIATLAYICILVVFFVQSRFTVDRYATLVHVLLLPSMILAMYQFMERFPRFSRAVVVVAVLVGVGNVVSLSPKRTHFFAAAEWIQSQDIGLERTFFYDARIPYYSGLGYREEKVDSKEALTEQMNRYDYFVIDLPAGDPLVQARLNSGQLELLAEFDNGYDRHMMILRRTGIAQ